MLQHIQQYWLDYAFGLITLLLGIGYKRIGTRVKATKTESDAIKDGVKALLHNQIIIMGKALVASGKCSPEDYKELEYLFTPYANLGGNGSAERIMEQVKKLPTN